MPPWFFHAANYQPVIDSYLVGVTAIETNRLKLIPLTAPFIKFILEGPVPFFEFTGIKFPAYIFSNPFRQKLKNFSNNQNTSPNTSFAVITRSDPTYIGHGELQMPRHENEKPALGYEILPLFRGCGYGDEMLKALLKIGFEEMAIHEITAQTVAKTNASSHLLMKNGFVFDGLASSGQEVIWKWRQSITMYKVKHLF